MLRYTKVVVNDIGLGLSVHVTTPNDKLAVFDLGASSTFSPLSKFYYNTVIDYLFITHPHRDHIQDIANLRYFPRYLNAPKGVDVDELINEARVEDKPIFKKYKNLVSSSAEEPTLYTQILPQATGGLFIQSFRAPSLLFNNLNDVSSITVLDFKGSKMVICGDNEKASLDELMRSWNFKQAIANADILIAPHHARESSFHRPFINAVRPALTLISDTSNVATSASNLYSACSLGMNVQKRKLNTTNYRSCLSTRKDGQIEVHLQRNTRVFID